MEADSVQDEFGELQVPDQAGPCKSSYGIWILSQELGEDIEPLRCQRRVVLCAVETWFDLAWMQHGLTEVGRYREVASEKGQWWL